MTGQARSGVLPALNVLYVEDYPLGIKLLLDSFSRRAPDIHVEVVSTVAQAIDRLTHFENGLADPGQSEQNPRYDVVLTDLNLPDGLGLDILAHVRNHRLMLAVVILTASTEEDMVTNALDSGANGYLAKRGDYLAQLPFALRGAVDRFRSNASRPLDLPKAQLSSPNDLDAPGE
jgi:CheY-like chemotaxis protein